MKDDTKYDVYKNRGPTRDRMDVLRTASGTHLAPLGTSHNSLGKPPMHRQTQQINLNSRIRSARPNMLPPATSSSKIPTYLNRA